MRGWWRGMQEKKAEENSHSRIEQYRSVFEHNPIAVLILKNSFSGFGDCENYENNEVVYRNPAMGKYVKCEDEIRLQEKGTRMYRQQIEFLDRVLSKQNSAVSHTFYDDNKQKYIDITGYLEDGYIVCMANDITDKVMLEKERVTQKLRADESLDNVMERFLEREENLNTAVSHAGIHYWNYDLTSQTIYMNDQTSEDFLLDSKLINYPDSWIKLGLVHTEDVEVFLDGISKVNKGVQYVQFFARIRDVKHYRYEWKNIKFTTFYDKEGKPSYAIATAENAMAYKKLEKSFSKVMHQNGLWSWEFNMVEHKLERINDFGLDNPFGLQGEEFTDVPESLFEQGIIMEEDWHVFSKMFQELYQGQDQVKAQCRSWSQKSKDYVWYEYVFTVIEKENGIPVRAIGTGRDISAQKRVEQLYQEEQKTLLVADDTLLASCRINLSKKRVESMVVRGENVPIENVMYQVDFKERASRAFDDIQLSDQDNYELSPEWLYHLYKSGVQQCEKRFTARRKNSQQSICVKVTCKMLERPESGDIIAFFYNKDDTAAYTNNLLVNTILTRDYEMAGVIYTNSRSFKVINGGRRANDDIISVVDYDAELKNYYNIMRKEDADRLIEQIHFEKLIQILEERSHYTVEYDMLDGEEIRRKQLRFTYASSDINIILVTRVDINDVVQSEIEKQRQLEDALNLAEKANNAKTEFLSTISHEIRTPMNVIIGMTELAKGEADNHEAVLNYIDEISLSSKHLLNIVNNVLDMSKIESGEFSLHPQRYSFAELQKRVSTMFTPLCAQKNIEFKTEGHGEHPDMIVDKVRLNQVIFNLLNNAVKYTDIGGKIEFSFINQVRENEMDTKFIVQDNGIGMSKKFQEQMFKPFTQESNAVVASSQGTGLGLSIAKGIVDKMGGELSVSSVLGKGTTFCVCITMPIAKEHWIENSDPAPEREIDFYGKTILVVEDHTLNQMIITKLLKNKGANVIISGNGKIGVEEFDASEPGSIDAVLMDVRMPVMDGLQATRAIRSLKREDAKTVPIIAMTANAYDEDREKSSEAGMNGHLAKPIDTKILYETLESFFGWQAN